VVPVAVLARVRRRGGWGRAEVRALELAVARRGHGAGRVREASGRGGAIGPRYTRLFAHLGPAN